MVLLPTPYQPTVEKIYKSYEDKNTDPFRQHLGASLIGTECQRKLWYGFRFCSSPNFSGRLLRLFQTGFKEEARIIDELRNIGVCVYDRDPCDGKQISYSEPDCPMFSGSLDGIGIGFEEAPKTYHVIEIKTSSSKAFVKMKKEGVQISKPLHYAQIQTYLRWSGLDRAFYFMVNKDTDEIYSERVYFEKDFAESLVGKAKRVIFSEVPLEKISDNPDSMFCKWCEHSGTCHYGKLPLVSCRTCSFVTPNQDGTWQCGRDDSILGEAKQKAGCDGHIFIPQLVPLPAVDSDPEVGTITYGSIVNGPGGTLSKDLQKVIDGSK